MAVDMFIKIGSIKGESQDKARLTFWLGTWGTSNSGSSHQGGGQGEGKVNIQDLSLTKM